MIQQLEINAHTTPATSQAHTRSEQAHSAPARPFEDIISDFWSDQNRGSALDYLRSLSGEELRAVGKEHGFADPSVDLYGLNLEGANNLLRARGETVDENRDGIEQIGKARTWRFPNGNTPEDVRAAWEEATAEMSDSESMLLAGVLFMPLPQVETDASGRVTRVIHPGDEGYRAPSLQPGYSYRNVLENKLRSLDDPSNPPADIDFYNKAKAFYTKLLNAFERHGVN